MNITEHNAGEVAGQPLQHFHCDNDNGLSMELTNYGATVIAVYAPDRNGNCTNVTLGFPAVEDYLLPHPSLGSTVGRFANRIAKGRFTIDDKTWQLDTNNGDNHLHGGIKGFGRQMWQYRLIDEPERVGVEFGLLSVDGDQRYPGNLQVVVRYLLSRRNELLMEYLAETDNTTPVNLTNHCYWNLAGAGSGSIANHIMEIPASRYLEVDQALIPTGRILAVRHADTDFRQAQSLKTRIAQRKPGGYDHCYLLDDPTDKSAESALAFAARLSEPGSGRTMTIRTNQPAIQFYTGNGLDGSKACGGFDAYAALCLETQHYPDSPNHPHFPTTLLQPGELYRHRTIHQFTSDT